MSRDDKMQKILHGASCAGELGAAARALHLAGESLVAMGELEAADKIDAMVVHIATLATQLVEKTDKAASEFVGGSNGEANV